MKEESRPAAAPASGSARNFLAERIGARRGLIDPKFIQKFFKPRRFQTWQKTGGPDLTRVGRVGSSLYQNFQARYQPPAVRIQRRFSAPAAAAAQWKPLDLALPVSAPPAPMQAARPEGMFAPNLPSIASLASGLPLSQRPAQPQGQIIPRKENDPDYAPNKSGKRAPAPVKPKLTPNQKLFTRVEEVIPGRPEAPAEEEPPVAAPRSAPPPAPQETPQPAPAPQTARSSAPTVQREMAAPQRPRPSQARPAPEQPIATLPPTPAVHSEPPAQPATLPPAESDAEKPAVVDQIASEPPVKPPVAAVQPAPARMAARPAEVQREVELPAPRKSPQAMPAAPARQPVRFPTVQPTVQPAGCAPAGVLVAVPDNRPLARMAARPAAAAPAQPVSKPAGVVQREFVPAVRPQSANAAPRLSLGSQRKWLAARQPKGLAVRPRPKISLMARPPLLKPTATIPSAKAPAQASASSVYLAAPEQVAATPPANLPVAKAPSPYSAFPDEPAQVAPSRPRPPASQPSPYLADPDQPSPEARPRVPTAYSAFDEGSAPVEPSALQPSASPTSPYLANPDLPSPEARPRVPTAYTAFNAEPETPASVPYAPLAFHGMDMPMAQSRPPSPTAQTPAARSAFFDRPLLPQQPGEQPEENPAAAYAVPPEFQDRAVGNQSAPLPDAAPLPEGYTDGTHDVPPRPSTALPEGYTDGSRDAPPPGSSEYSRPSPDPSQAGAPQDVPQTIAIAEPPVEPPSVSPAPMPAQTTGGDEQSLNFDQIARQVYPIILRKLRVERERNSGRPR